TTASSPLLAFCEERRAGVRSAFEAGESATLTLRALSDLADETLFQIFHSVFSTLPRQGIALLAIGGYGRKLLFPHSDLDVLFLFEDEATEARMNPLIGELSRTLWDVGFRVSFAGRTIEECKRVEEDNAEFHISLLDRRFLTGDRELYERLH